MPAPRLIAPALLLALASPALAQPKTFELRGTSFADVTAQQPAARPAAPELDAIRALVDRRQFGRAKGRAVDWLLAHPNDPNRDRALLIASDAISGRGDKIRAFYYLDQLMDERPGSPLFDTALERQYGIADAFLDGYKQRFLGLPILGGESEAVEMLFRIRERAPGSPIAERSLRRTADYYYDDGQFDLAADTYGAFAQAYPRSPAVSEARLRQAYSNLAQFRGGSYDATPAVEGRAQLAQLAALDPDLSRAGRPAGAAGAGSSGRWRARCCGGQSSTAAPASRWGRRRSTARCSGATPTCPRPSGRASGWRRSTCRRTRWRTRPSRTRSSPRRCRATAASTSPPPT